MIVYDQDHPLGFWKIAKVCRLITGKDGQTRGALLEVAGNAAKTTLLRRPVHLIYPLVVSHIATPIAPPEDTVDRAPEYEQENGELFSPPQRPHFEFGPVNLLGRTTDFNCLLTPAVNWEECVRNFELSHLFITSYYLYILN